MNCQLSVNLNKIALLRNSRLHDSPSLLEFARFSIEAGAPGITLHPRADERHIRLDDVLDLAALDSIAKGKVELNIEGDGRIELLRLIDAIVPTQFTLVPCRPGELTSERGWRAYDDSHLLSHIRERLGLKTRLSLFIDPEPAAVDNAHAFRCDAVEIYTGTYALTFGTPRGAAELSRIAATARRARELGLRVHCGHDLNLINLPELVRLVRPDEVSIGHALTADALIHGFKRSVQLYQEAIAKGLSSPA